MAVYQQTYWWDVPLSPASSARSSATFRSVAVEKRFLSCHNIVRHSWIWSMSIPVSSALKVSPPTFFVTIESSRRSCLPLQFSGGGADGGLSRIMSRRSISRIICRNDEYVSARLLPIFSNAYSKNFTPLCARYRSKTAGVTAARFMLISLLCTMSSIATRAFKSSCGSGGN